MDVRPGRFIDLLHVSSCLRQHV